MRRTQFVQFQQQYSKAHKLGAKGLNLRDWGRILGWICLLGSLVFWIPASWIMTAPATLLSDGTVQSTDITSWGDAGIAIAFGVFLAVGPSVVISIFVPGTRAGRLLLKLRLLTPGKIVAGGIGIFLLQIGFQIMLTWWHTRTAGAVGLDVQWALLGVIFTMVAPALFFEPVSREELREDLQAEHEAHVYEIASKARINLMLKGQQEAENLMAQGLHTLTAKQLEVVAGYIQAFARAVDERHEAWAAQAGGDAKRASRYRALGADPRTTNLLAFLGELAGVQGVDIAGTKAAIGQFVEQGLAAEPGIIPNLPAPVLAPGAEPVAPTQAVSSAPTEDVSLEDSPAARALQLPDEDYQLLDTAIRQMQDLPCWTRAALEQRMQAVGFQFGRAKANATIASWRTQGFVCNGDTANTYVFTIGIQQ